MLLKWLRRRRARPLRHAAFGVSDSQRVWAVSVNGADPLVIGGIDDSAARLVCNAANTLELSDRALRWGFVWDLGDRPIQSRTIPPAEFREVHSGETAHPGDSAHLMAVACKQLAEEGESPRTPAG